MRQRSCMSLFLPRCVNAAVKRLTQGVRRATLCHLQPPVMLNTKLTLAPTTTAFSLTSCKFPLPQPKYGKAVAHDWMRGSQVPILGYSLQRTLRNVFRYHDCNIKKFVLRCMQPIPMCSCSVILGLLFYIKALIEKRLGPIPVPVSVVMIDAVHN